MTKAEKDSKIITTICEYENSVAMPDNERLTYLDACGIVRLKDGNGNVKAQEAYANRCSEYLRFGQEVDLAACGTYSPYDALKVCDTPEIFLKTGFEQRPMVSSSASEHRSMMKPSNPSRSHLETIQLSLQYASATAKASSAASRRFIFALKLSSTPSPPLQRLIESVYPSMSVPSLHEPLPVTLMQPETVGEQGFPFFRRNCLSHCQAYFPPSAPFWLTNNKYSRPSNHKHGKP